MRVRIIKLVVTTRRTREILDFSPTITFIHGPVGTGKSTVARLIDYCLGGKLERTPAVRQEFVASTLSIDLGIYHCDLERAATDTQSVRVSWSTNDGEYGSVNAPLQAGDVALVNGDVYNLSDLLFFFCGVKPIKVRQRLRDPESPMIRLSFRDVWWYCYLDQTELDSSFFRFEDFMRRRKSQDVMRFFTGLHSERISELESELYRTIDEQKGKREAVRQIREFMARFDLGSGLDVASRIKKSEQYLERAEAKRTEIERQREVELHPTDPLRDDLRALANHIEDLVDAIDATEAAIAEQRALRAELITSKIKAQRAEQAGKLLGGIDYGRCPQCGSDISTRTADAGSCHLCRSPVNSSGHTSSMETEAVRRELNHRIDQIAESIERREEALERSKRDLKALRTKKGQLDQILQRELARYDSAFVETVRQLDTEIATLVERQRSLEKLQEMPRAIDGLEKEAGALQGGIDSVVSALKDEQSRLRQADEKVDAIARHFKSIMRQVGFPGVSGDDKVVVDPRNWRPTIRHNGQEWSFWDAGSGGKKTLFNVCYALAIHEAGLEHNMPVPNILVIDSPTKNISEDENPELVHALYREIYRFAASEEGNGTQFLLIDSDFVRTGEDTLHFLERHMAGQPDAPSLIPYYEGP